MELAEQLNRQRVKHIVSSYQLDGDDPAAFDLYLEDLLNAYPAPLIELALVENLVDQWLRVPMPRGGEFLAQAHAKLTTWEQTQVAVAIAPAQFQEITGLDPTPIFGSPETQRPQPPIHPLIPNCHGLD